MKQMEAPRCRLCEKNHWAREGCYGMLVKENPRERATIDRAGERPGTGALKDSAQVKAERKGATAQPITNIQREATIARPDAQAGAGARHRSTPAAAVSRRATNTQREGRRVLKGSTPKAPGAKPTRTASTERANPPQPARPSANGAIGEKPAGGTAKPRRLRKNGGKKKCA